MKLDDLIIRAISIDLDASTRDDKRIFNKNLKDSKWIVIYPMAEDETVELHDRIYNKVTMFFSNEEPTFIPRGYTESSGVLDKLSSTFDDLFYWASWKEISMHMNGTIWIETKRIKPGVIEPAPFSELVKSPVLGYDSNVNLHQAVTSYMNVCEDLEVDRILEQYLESLPPEVLRLDIIYNDTEKDTNYLYGSRTSIIYYNNEVIGYIHSSGRELLFKKFVTTDINKYRAAMKDIVDKSGISDKMGYYNVEVVNTEEDADIYLSIPVHTPSRFV